MRNKIQAPGKQVLHKQVPKAQAIQKEKDPRLVAVGGFGQEIVLLFYYTITKPSPKPPQAQAQKPLSERGRKVVFACGRN